MSELVVASLQAVGIATVATVAGLVVVRFVASTRRARRVAEAYSREAWRARRKAQKGAKP